MRLLCGDRLDGSKAPAIAAVSKLHPSRYLGEQGIVRPDADVEARLDLGAALANDDRSAGNEFAAKGLHAQPLCIGVASVCGAAPTLFMCHCRILFSIGVRAYLASAV